MCVWKIIDIVYYDIFVVKWYILSYASIGNHYLMSLVYIMKPKW